MAIQNQFQIVFTGKILPGFAAAQVRQAASERLKLTPTNQEALFSGRRAVLKRGLDFEAGDRIREEYAKLGMKVHLEPETPLVKPAPAGASGPASQDAELDDILPPLSEAEAHAAPVATKGKPASTLPITVIPVPAQKAGGSSEVSLAPPAVSAEHDEIVCPKCNTRQPKRTLCRSCGLDMPRFIASQEQAERDARQAKLQAAATTQQKPLARPFAPKAPKEVNIDIDIDRPMLVGLGFTGRFSRTSYLSSYFICVSLICLSAIVALKMGAFGLAVGMLVATWLSVRAVVLRLHDIGQSGLLVLLCLIPVIGTLFSLALLAWPGSPGRNDYGNEAPAASMPTQLISFFGMILCVALLINKADEFHKSRYAAEIESVQQEAPEE